MPRVFHYVSTISRYDAVSNSANSLNRSMLHNGVDSFMSCQDDQRHNAPNFTLSLAELLKCKVSRDDLIVYHYTFFDDNGEYIANLPCRKVIVYHNITPGRFFREVGHDGIANGCDAGRAQLGEMAGAFDAVVGVSAFNGAELAELGYVSPRVIPVFYDDHFFAGGGVSDQAFLDRRLSGEISLVCIGRLVPNKRPDNLIRVLAILKKMVSRPVRLRWHGKVWDRDYMISLRRLAEDLGVEHEVSFEINQPAAALRASLASADCFVSVSEHEGFMVPLLEAFSAACPVVALDAAAVGETCGPAACLVREPDLELIAAHVANIHSDRDLRLSLIRGQSRRAQDFSRRRTLAKWNDLLSQFIPTPLVSHAHRV